MMATADVLALYFQVIDSTGQIRAGADFTVICEHHEDWSVLANGNSEIISGKHREASVGAFSTLRQLLDEGGVLHLLNRWDALQATPACRLVTTAGLSGDAAKLGRVTAVLRDAPQSDHAEVVATLQLMQRSIQSIESSNGVVPPQRSAELLRRFLRSLRIDDSLARREHLPDMAPTAYGEPVAQRLGRPGSGSAVWRAVLALVRPRMRNAGPSEGGSLPVVLGVAHDEPLAPRSLALLDVHEAIQIALENERAYAPLPRIVKANVMAVKMTRGGCSDNTVERADRLRLQYGRYWRASRGNPSTFDKRRRLDNLLLRVLDEATESVRTPDSDWGGLLWRELCVRLGELESDREAQGLSADLLLGGISDLANRCEAWYTDRFNAREALQRLMVEQAAS
jgi:hypothetical protein